MYCYQLNQDISCGHFPLVNSGSERKIKHLLEIIRLSWSSSNLVYPGAWSRPSLSTTQEDSIPSLNITRLSTPAANKPSHSNSGKFRLSNPLITPILRPPRPRPRSSLSSPRLPPSPTPSSSLLVPPQPGSPTSGGREVILMERTNNLCILQL